MSEQGEKTRFDRLAQAAERYGERALENYAQIRSLAETVSAGFCRYLGDKKICVHLVPPEGAWAPQPYRSGAFSVSGQGFLPLAPISFGLAVRVSHTGDWLRLVLHAAKIGHDFSVTIQGGRKFDFHLPVDDAQLHAFFGHLESHLVGWFEEHVDRYDHGEYGGRDIGFEFIHEDATGGSSG